MARSNSQVERIKQLHERHLHRSAEKTEAESSSTPRSAKVLQLPIWSDERRGVPNDLVRSALFSIANRRAKRAYLRNAEIAALGSIVVRYTGEQLTQLDEDVFLQIVHMARLSPLGDSVEFTAHGMLKSLGWTTDGRAYDRLRESIQRLKATGLEVHNQKNGYSGSMIRDFAWQEMDGKSSRTWKVRLEPRIIALFGLTSYSQIDWEQRLQLSGPLAKWLHSFYYTHREPLPMKVATLHRLCGSTAKQMFKFRQNLREALGELQSVGFLESWRIVADSDLVQVRRAGREPALKDS